MRMRPLGKTGIEVSELSLGGLLVSSHGENSHKAAPPLCAPSN